MTEIRLTRSFLRNPMNSIAILLGTYALIEGASWAVGIQTKLHKVEELGGPIKYIGLVFGTILLPEIFTLSIVIFLLYQTHNWLKLDRIENNWQAIRRYELRFLPILVFSFFLFNPITQTVRFLFEGYPNYEFKDYWEGYILKTFSLKMYLLYLFAVLVIGYAALNISLLKDFLKQRKEAQEKAEAKAAEAEQKYLALSETFSPKPTAPSSTYLSYLKGKSNLGELDFPVNEAYYFTVEDRSYYAETIKERYMVNKTINELEAELDPTQFFRIKRDYIVNRQAVLHYSYWENGKYIVTLNNPGRYEIIVPRVRMQEFREWLQRDAGKPEPADLM